MKAVKKFFSDESILRIDKMLAALVADGKNYNQDAYPTNMMGYCNTEFCMAGFAVLANDPARYAFLIRKDGRHPLSVQWQTEARKALKIKPADHILRRIFGTASEWYDERSKARYHAAKTHRGRVSAAVGYWKKIVKTDGAILQGW